MITWIPTELQTTHEGVVYTARCHSNDGSEWRHVWTVTKRFTDKPNIPPAISILTEKGWEPVLMAKGDPLYITKNRLDNIHNL